VLASFIAGRLPAGRLDAELAHARATPPQTSTSPALGAGELRAA
jgi:hypothetical protein